MSSRPSSTALFRSGLVVALAAITYLATTPVQYEVIAEVNDKLQHVAAFYGLAFLADFSFPRRRFGVRKALGLLGYALALEAVQSFLPYRSAEWQDLVAGAAGLAGYAASVPLLARSRTLGWRWRHFP